VAKKTEDPSMTKVRSLFEKSELTLHDLGLKMGFAPEIARQAVFQFLKTKDPHISMLRKFAKALGVELEELTSSR
jgi:transcriptional regulator with XRE-family HTH domain